ncbi:MAG: hypothetical protein PHQ98_04395 [Candidatus ainarchaeum sp.]|nr:hypothetical protein [Candidatus ainarchaeum sp.]
MSKNPIKFFISLIGIYIILWVVGLIVSEIPVPDGGFALGANLIKMVLPDPNQEILLNIIKYLIYSGGAIVTYIKF